MGEKPNFFIGEDENIRRDTFKLFRLNAEKEEGDLVTNDEIELVFNGDDSLASGLFGIGVIRMLISGGEKVFALRHPKDKFGGLE